MSRNDCFDSCLVDGFRITIPQLTAVHCDRSGLLKLYFGWGKVRTEALDQENGSAVFNELKTELTMKTKRGFTYFGEKGGSSGLLLRDIDLSCVKQGDKHLEFELRGVKGDLVLSYDSKEHCASDLRHAEEVIRSHQLI